MTDTTSRGTWRLALCAAGVILASRGAAAQSEGRGFLFERPHGGISLRAGFAAARATSDVFAFTTSQLTVDRGDFSGLGLEFDANVALNRQTELVLSGGYSRTSARSEYRDFVDQNYAPIEQTTKFQRFSLTANVRQYLTARGRSIGKFAWVPARFAPYVGVGGGAIWYRFHQAGDFVDYETNDVFAATLGSSGWAPAARALAGVDLTLSPRVVLNAQTAYLFAKAAMHGDYSGFDRVELSGLSTGIGLALRW